MIRKGLAVLGITFFLAAQVSAEEAPVLKTQQDKVNYGIGMSMGKSLKRQGIEVDLDMVVRGMKDVLTGGKPLLSDEDFKKTMMEFQKEMQAKHAATMQKAGEDNKKEGAAFLEKNKKEKGVVTLKDGLQYKILKEGQGKKPKDTDMVEVNYKGTLINGKEFDASKSGQPAIFEVKQVIPGWQEALKLMPAGSKWQIVIPPELAYGAKGAGADIGPNATLIFEVELVSIK